MEDDDRFRRHGDLLIGSGISGDPSRATFDFEYAEVSQLHAAMFLQGLDD
jgi:hypothetical protein